MHALSMIDMGAKAPETVAPAKPAEPQDRQFGEVLGRQRRPEQAHKRPTEAKQQPVSRQPAEKTAEAKGQPAERPKTGPQVAENQTVASTDVIVDAKPELQQSIMQLMKAIAGENAPKTSEENGPIQELLTQMLQQLEAGELEGEQVLAGIDLSALVEQLQGVDGAADEEQLAQLVLQLEEQLANEAGLSTNAELAAAMLPVSDAQATAPKLVENLARARQILQQAIDNVAAQKVSAAGTEKAVVAEEAVLVDEDGFNPNLSLEQEAAEEIDPRFAGLLKPRSASQPQQTLRQQVQAANGKMNPAAETVKQAGELPVEQSKVAEFVEQLSNNPKQAFENLAQQNQAQAQPVATAQTQSMTGKVMPDTPMVQLPSGQQVSEGQIFDQVVARFSGSFNGESSRMVLRMQPAELGSLKLELVVEGDRIRANLQAQSMQVQEVLERNLPQLRSALAEQGLKVDEFQIDVNQEQNQQEQFEHLAQQQQQRRDSRQQADLKQLWEEDEQIIPLAHLMQNGGGGISLHV